MNDSLATVVGDFLAHKRALGRKYLTEEATLRLLLDFAVEHGIAALHELSTPLLETFVASRPRERARSFNHLVGVLGCFLDWVVIQGRLVASPLRRVHRRDTDERLPFIFDAVGARRVLDAAAALADNPRGKGRGATHHAIFALCYGLGLEPAKRAVFASATSTPTASSLWCGAASSARAASSPTARAWVSYWLARSSAEVGGRRGRYIHLRQPTVREPRNPEPGVPSPRRRVRLPGPRWHLHAPPALAPPLLRCGGACCAGIGRESTRRAGSSSSPRSWATSAHCPQRSTCGSHRSCSPRAPAGSRPSRNQPGRRRPRDRRPAHRTAHPLVLRRSPRHRQGSAPDVGAQLPGHDQAALLR